MAASQDGLQVLAGHGELQGAVPLSKDGHLGDLKHRGVCLQEEGASPRPRGRGQERREWDLPNEARPTASQ